LATAAVLKTVEVLKPLGVRLSFSPLFVMNFMNEQFYKEFYERIQHSVQISIKYGHNDYALGLKKAIIIVNELKQKYQGETK